MYHRSVGNRVGEVLASKYRLEELLGSGGMGHVYRAVNEHVGRAVAIKVLRQEHAQNAQIVERFLREARAANLVRHPHVVDVLDIGREDGGAPFIVQELLEGEDLSQLVTRRGGKLPLEEVITLLSPVIDAVAEAHHKGVVHRDIKPENVFLVKSPRGPIPKLLDFGISKITAPDLRATEVGVMMGTPAYMAPEQIQGSREADPRSDVWALGVMFFELIAGRMPFEAQDAPQLFFLIATKDAPTLLDVQATVTREISRIVERCLRRQPGERYPTASELARDLKHVMDGHEIEETGRHSIPPSLRSRVTDLGIPMAPRAPSLPEDVDAKGGTAPGHGFAAALDAAEDGLPKAPSLLPPTPRTVAKAPAVKPQASPAAPAPAPAPAPASTPALRSAPDLVSAAISAPASARGPAAPVSTRYAPPDGRSRLAPEASLPGVGLAPGPSSTSKRGSLASWGAPPPERADLSPIIGLGVVGLVAILGTGLLMRLVHRPEGWPVARFAIAASEGLALGLHAVLALGALGVGVAYFRRGLNHWRGDLGGGPPGAIISALVAAGAFFCAIELVSAVY
jgi:serine/threonine-protein kinase